MKGPWRAAAFGIGLGVLAWAGGFGWFVHAAGVVPPAPPAQVGGIGALTGGSRASGDGAAPPWRKVARSGCWFPAWDGRRNFMIWRIGPEWIRACPTA